MAERKRACDAVLADGRACRAAPLVDSRLCFMHDPARSDEAAAARRIGGNRRRRESSLDEAYDLGERRTLDYVWRIYEVVVSDLIPLDKGIPRSRALIAAAAGMTKLIEETDHEVRIAALESAYRRRLPPGGAATRVMSLLEDTTDDD